MLQDGHSGFLGENLRGAFFLSMVKHSMCSLTHLDSQVRRPTHLLYISCLSFPLFLTFWVHNLVLFHPDLTRYLRDVTADPLQKLQPLASSRCTYGFNVPVRLSLIFLENIGRMQRNVLSKVRKGLEGRKVSFGWTDGQRDPGGPTGPLPGGLELVHPISLVVIDPYGFLGADIETNF